jgi:hypothetical protein
MDERDYETRIYDSLCMALLHAEGMVQALEQLAVLLRAQDREREISVPSWINGTDREGG